MLKNSISFFTTISINSNHRMSGKTHVLSVGLNYRGQYQLNGCHNDVDRLKKVLYDSLDPQKRGIYSSLKDDGVSSLPTFETIKEEVEKLFKELKENDAFIFTYSGHGGRVADKDGDEKSGYDDCIYDYNFKEITDDILYELLVDKLPNKVKLRVILDCCHSGTGLDLPWGYSPFGSKENTSKKVTGKNVVCISGCTDEETSADAWIDRKPQGALTAILSEILETKKNKDNQESPKLNSMRWKDLETILYYEMKKCGYEQDPQLSLSTLVLSEEKVDL